LERVIAFREMNIILSPDSGESLVVRVMNQSTVVIVEVEAAEEDEKVSHGQGISSVKDSSS